MEEGQAGCVQVAVGWDDREVGRLGGGRTDEHQKKKDREGDWGGGATFTCLLLMEVNPGLPFSEGVMVARSHRLGDCDTRVGLITDSGRREADRSADLINKALAPSSSFLFTQHQSSTHLISLGYRNFHVRVTSQRML